MRRIVLIGAYPLSKDCIHGGVEASVFGLAQELSKTHEVNVFDMPRIGGIDSVEQGTIFVNRFANLGTHNEDMTSRLQEYIRDIVALHPDMVHIHGTGEFCRRLYLAITHYGYLCIVTIHGLLAVEKRKALRNSIYHISKLPKALYQYYKQRKSEYEFIKNIDHAIVDTQYVVEALYKYPITKLPQLHVIPQGIDDFYYTLHCNENSNVILSVGTISQRKGHLLLVDAFNNARKQGMKATLHIVGVVADVVYYRRLQEAISRSPYSESITLTTNATREELYEAYRNAKLFALHSQEESQGIVFAEAMATGLPIVATNVGGVPFVVQDKIVGCLSQFGDVNTFANNLKTLMEDNNKWSSYSQSAVQYAKNYQWSEITAKISSLYSQIKKIN